MVVQGLAERREGGGHFDAYVQIIDSLELALRDKRGWNRDGKIGVSLKEAQHWTGQRHPLGVMSLRKTTRSVAAQGATLCYLCAWQETSARVAKNNTRVVIKAGIVPVWGAR
jgi:hypothetical protein